MTPKKPRIVGRPEASLQEKIVKFLEERGWLVEVMHASYALKGIPDLYCWNQNLGIHRWIDVKLPVGSDLTKAQCQKWPEWEKVGLGVWIMKSTEDYQKLFSPPNWREMWKPRHEKYVRSVENILSELDDE